MAAGPTDDNQPILPVPHQPRQPSNGSRAQQLGKPLILVVGLAMALTSGTQYAFGGYERLLKDTLHITQLQVQTLGVLLDAGDYIGHPITGYIYDTVGPAGSALGAALLVSSRCDAMTQWWCA